MPSIELDLPETIMPRAPLGPDGPRSSPERGLMLAVLGQALDDLRKERRLVRARRAHLRPAGVLPARIWFERSSSRWPFSFERVCEELDLDAAAIRRLVGVALG